MRAERRRHSRHSPTMVRIHAPCCLDDCRSPSADVVSELLGEYGEHINEEEEKVVPLVQRYMSPEAQRTVGQEIKEYHKKLPTGKYGLIMFRDVIAEHPEELPLYNQIFPFILRKARPLPLVFLHLACSPFCFHFCDADHHSDHGSHRWPLQGHPSLFICSALCLCSSAACIGCAGVQKHLLPSLAMRHGNAGDLCPLSKGKGRGRSNVTRPGRITARNKEFEFGHDDFEFFV